jgi:NADP-dependent 3-hydroxy acid dehydrogenase YdfG
MLLKNKVAVVYGAGGSVGSAIARKFALEGAVVYITARRLESIKTLVDGDLTIRRQGQGSGGRRSRGKGY